MSPLARWWLRNATGAVLRVTAFVARRHEAASLRLMRALARGTVRRKRIGPAKDLAALGLAWQRGFPSARQVPITAIDERTVHAEIRTPCPLRGTGDVTACWRMMAYDREVARAAGGEFVVLRSQAQPGVTVCQVALRQRGADLSDLRAAHEAARALST